MASTHPIPDFIRFPGKYGFTVPWTREMEDDLGVGSDGTEDQRNTRRRLLLMGYTLGLVEGFSERQALWTYRDLALADAEEFQDEPQNKVF